MEPNYSWCALIRASCQSITRGVTFAFQSPSVCFEICDNHSRFPFATARIVWFIGKKAWPIAMQEFPCFQFRTLLLCSFTSLHTSDNNSGCVCVLERATVEIRTSVRRVREDSWITSVCITILHQSGVDQTVNYFERAPEAVTERRRLNIQDQMLSSNCHIMRQSQEMHTEWSNWEHTRELSPQTIHPHRQFSAVQSNICMWPSLCAFTITNYN